MKLIYSSEGAKRASISKHFQIGKPKIKVGRRKYVIPDDIEKSKVTSEQNEMTGGRMLLIILLAVTIIGLLLAIPLYFAAKKKRVVMAFKAKDGHEFSVMASDNLETEILKRYSAIGAF